MRWKNIFHVEKNPYCRKLLKQNFPNANTHGDIKETDFTIYRGCIDVLSGGDPCQPSSVAGKRKGEEDIRFLWPEMRRAYNECEAGFVVNENVPGTVSNGILDEKILNLEADGYTCWPPVIIPAGATGALHRRDRVWLVAHSMRTRQRQFYAATVAEDEKERNVWNNAVSTTQFGSTSWNPDKSGILRAAYGIPDRVDRNKRISIMGNSIQPQVAFKIFQAIHQYKKAA